MKNLISLMLLISFGTVGAIFFTPGLPEITEYFKISAESSSLLITLYLIGYAVGQLIYGPIANSIGSKKTIIFGALIALFGTGLSILSGITHSFNLLIVGRIITALGACSGLKMAFNLSGFMYKKEKVASVLSLLTMAFAIIPSIGIFLSGIIVKQYGWISSFYLMIFYCCLILFLSITLPEVYSKNNRKTLSFSITIKDYFAQFKNKSVVLSGLLVGTSTAIFYTFSTMAPFIAIKNMGLTPALYGTYNFLPSFGLVFGSIIASFYSKKFKQTKSIFIGITLVSICALVLFITLTTFKHNPLSLFVPIIFTYIGVAFIYGSSASIGVNQSLDKSNASSVIGFLNMLSACAMMLILSKINLENLLLPKTYLFLTIIGFIWLSIVKTETKLAK